MPPRRSWHHAGSSTHEVEWHVKILLVSSGPSLTRQVSAALPVDAEVVEVRTPQRGLAVIDEGEHTFDVIVGDADTHPTGGFFLAREVVARKTDGMDLPPVVLLIARPQDEYLSRWAQADAWVVKPIDPFDLAEVLQAFADGTDVPALPGVDVLGHPPRLGPGGGVNADRTLLGGTRTSRRELEPSRGDDRG
jgi:CheY-like chemotaxis protein